ncbi:(2Fe-2S)-binding protein [Pseudonocardia sp. NPDC049154]|uniref:(2Fe-2S)-binding protein n=1 Tax=Pseudonocardia sp. NPDC049154 TaxID=3155501 RepID=UPI0033EE7C77
MPEDRPADPLAETAAQLDAVHPRFGFDPGTPAGPEWHRFDTLTDGRLAGWAAELTGEGRAPSEVAMSLLSGMTGPVVRPLAVASILFARLPLVTSATVWVRRRGRITDRAALTCPVAVLADDPLAGRTPVVADLRAELAERLVGLCAPVVDELHRATRYGRRNLWGGLGDVLSSHSLWAGRHRGDDPDALVDLFAEVQGVLDRVRDRIGVNFDRPVPFPLRGHGRATLAQVRGTCCLHYRIPSRTHADGSPRYCGTCPLIDDEERRVRLRPLVEPAATAARTAHLGTPTG